MNNNINKIDDHDQENSESMNTLVHIQSNETSSSMEIQDLKNQLDEVKTRSMIIETTKQDEIDELKFRSKQEIDSLNHIIDALQTDLNGLRSDYDSLKVNFKELKKGGHHHHHHSQHQLLNTSTSPISTKTSISNNNNNNNNNNTSPATNLANIQQIENESLEEDMRKAKESADMLRSVVLPLETEITTLRSRSNTSEQRIKELEQLIDEKEKEKKNILEEEQKIISECLNIPIETELEQFKQTTEENPIANDYFKKYIQLKKYLKRTETKFVDYEQTNLKAIRQVYSMLTSEQKMRLIPNRSKKLIKNKSTTTQNEEDELNIKQNETIQRIEELLSTLTTTNSETDNVSIDTTSSSVSNASSSNANSILPATATYAELLAMYEKEKLACLDMETNFQHKAKESSKQIETLNQEMNNLSTIIDDLRQQYLKMQVQYQYQVDSLIKLNENLRADLQQSEYVNSLFKAENLKLKAEIKQFQGEQTMLLKDFDQQYHPTQSIDEANRQLNLLRTELVRMYQANQSLHRQHNISLESIKQLQKSNLHLQRGGGSNNNNNNTNNNNTTSSTQDDHTVMMQSLESELERERKVRTEAENDLTDMKQQLKQIKDKSHSIVDSLRQKCEQNEFELRKFKEDNMELTNQIQSLKKESNNSLSVQEDLVRLIQSLQIELSQMKQASEVGGGAGVSGTTATETNMIVVRCQDENDFNNCANCTNQFSSAKKKQRCKHCCKIFCNDCCAKTVLSGPNLRPHKVCDSCHTLLDKDVKTPNPTSSSK